MLLIFSQKKRPQNKQKIDTSRKYNMYKQKYCFWLPSLLRFWAFKIILVRNFICQPLYDYLSDCRASFNSTYQLEFPVQSLKNVEFKDCVNVIVTILVIWYFEPKYWRPRKATLESSLTNMMTDILLLLTFLFYAGIHRPPKVFWLSSWYCWLV